MNLPTQLRRINADGVLQLDGRIYLVPGSNPGDLVEVLIKISGICCRRATEQGSQWRAAQPLQRDRHRLSQAEARKISQQLQARGARSAARLQRLQTLLAGLRSRVAGS